MSVGLGVFARAPVAGQVKTRIADALGDAAALQIYRQLFDHTLTRLERFEGALYLYITGDFHSAFADRSRLAAWTVRPQSGPGLAARMYDAVREMHLEHDKVLLVGTDCPLLGVAHLQGAVGHLVADDAVLIPAEDGGFVLIGSSSREMWKNGRCLTGIRTGTHYAFRDAWGCLRQAGAKVAVLDPLWDVDTPEDVDRAQQFGLLAPAAE